MKLSLGVRVVFRANRSLPDSSVRPIPADGHRTLQDAPGCALEVGPMPKVGANFEGLQEVPGAAGVGAMTCRTKVAQAFWKAEGVPVANASHDLGHIDMRTTEMFLRRNGGGPAAGAEGVKGRGPPTRAASPTPPLPWGDVDPPVMWRRPCAGWFRDSG